MALTITRYYLDPSTPDGLRAVETPVCERVVDLWSRHYQLHARVAPLIEGSLVGDARRAELEEQLADSLLRIRIHAENCDLCRAWLEESERLAAEWAAKQDCREKAAREPARVGRMVKQQINQLWAG